MTAIGSSNHALPHVVALPQPLGAPTDAAKHSAVSLGFSGSSQTAMKVKDSDIVGRKLESTYENANGNHVRAEAVVEVRKDQLEAAVEQEETARDELKAAEEDLKDAGQIGNRGQRIQAEREARSEVAAATEKLEATEDKVDSAQEALAQAKSQSALWLHNARNAYRALRNYLQQSAAVRAQANAWNQLNQNIIAQQREQLTLDSIEQAAIHARFARESAELRMRELPQQERLISDASHRFSEASVRVNTAQAQFTQAQSVLPPAVQNAPMQDLASRNLSPQRAVPAPNLRVQGTPLQYQAQVARDAQMSLPSQAQASPGPDRGTEVAPMSVAEAVDGTPVVATSSAEAPVVEAQSRFDSASAALQQAHSALSNAAT